MTTKTRTKRTGLQKAMRELGARSFMDFLTMRWFDEELARERTIVQVALPPDPTALDGGGGLIDFEVWEHLEEVIELVGVERLLSFMKARQVGLTWVIAAYCLWLAMYHQASKVLIFSQGDKEAKAFLRRIHSIYDNLPEFMREPLGTDNTSEMEFPTMSSRIEALPSTEKAGRSETVSLIVQDEADFHEHIDVNFAAMKPTIDSGGQVIQISTVDKNKPLSLFKTIWRNAKEGINGWTARFYGWEVRPGRTQEWYDRVEREAPDTPEMSKLLYMEQEYPKTWQEALRPSRVLAAFDVDVLDRMFEFSREPIATRENGNVRIWQKWHTGGRYGVGGDSSKGTGRDRSVLAILDLNTGIVVADVQGNLLSEEEFARMSVALCAEYQDPKAGIEDNDWGIAVIRAMQDLGYTNFYERKTIDGKDSGNIGWHTDEKSRYALFGDLIPAINGSLITMYAEDAIADFQAVVRNPLKNGRIEAAAGLHDDYPIAVGIAWMLRTEVYTYSTETEIHRFATS